MLTFVTPDKGIWIVDNIRERVGPGLREAITHLDYDDLADRPSLPVGAYVFVGLGLVTEAQREAGVAAWDALAAARPDLPLLNHPARALGRADLLKTLHEAGRNDFQVFRPEEVDGRAVRYPVFVREAEYHTGSLTDLLADAEALSTALDDLQRRGYENLLVVEFCDTSDAAGVHRKYSAFKVGDVILPRYLSLGYEWVVKENSPDRGDGSELYDAARLEEEMEYLRTNPHDAWLRETFALANIDYGRIDYGIWRGRPQVWEINTHPAIGPYPGTQRSEAMSRRREQRMAAKRHFYDRWIPLLAGLADVPAGDPIPLRLPGDLIARLARDRRERERRAREATSMKQVLRHAGRWIPKVPLLSPLRRSVSDYLQRKATARERTVDPSAR